MTQAEIDWATVIGGPLNNRVMPRPDGVTQGVKVRVSTEISAGESASKICESLLFLFPDFPIEAEYEVPLFPVSPDPVILKSEGLAMTTLLERSAEQRVLDTALDAMGQRLSNGRTRFRLSRQAALAGKVAFGLLGQRPVGGTILVELEGEGLAEWMEEATWHPGREDFPRQLGDDFAMRKDGAPVDWID